MAEKSHATRFGDRGEWWVVAQYILVPVALILAGSLRIGPAWPPLLRAVALMLAGFFMVVGLVLGVAGVLHLGHSFTTLPRPRDNGMLVQTGAYAIVRHPIYSGVIFGVLGWALLFNSLIGLALAVVVLVFFDQKSRREEAWLVKKYPGYSAYRRRVRKLIPFIY